MRLQLPRAGMRPSWSSLSRSSSAHSQAPRRPRTAAHRAGRAARGHSADTEAPVGPFEPQGDPDHSHAPSGPLAQNAHDDAAEQRGPSRRSCDTGSSSSSAPHHGGGAAERAAMLTMEGPCTRKGTGAVFGVRMIRKGRRKVACRLGALADVPQGLWPAPGGSQCTAIPGRVGGGLPEPPGPPPTRRPRQHGGICRWQQRAGLPRPGAGTST